MRRQEYKGQRRNIFRQSRFLKKRDEGDSFRANCSIVEINGVNDKS